MADTPGRCVKVLLADSDGAFRSRIPPVLEGSGLFEVVGEARDGDEVLRMALARRPEVILMNVDLLPRGGLETTRRIMAQAPVPIVVYPSGRPPRNGASVERAFAALREGAVAVVDRPFGAGFGEEGARRFIQTLLVMAQVPVVTRKKPGRTPTPEPEAVRPVVVEARSAAVNLVVIGASTGGPLALKRVFSRLPEHFPMPILVVQHIAPGFLESMVRWLDSECALRIKIAEAREPALGGHVYFAPDGLHMGVDFGGRIALDSSPPLGGMRPAVSFLFGSVATTYGGRAVGVLLSGMGTDGSLALEEMRRGGAVTIVQDENSSAVFGMARRAIELGGAEHVLSPEEIGELLVHLARIGREGLEPESMHSKEVRGRTMGGEG